MYAIVTQNIGGNLHEAAIYLNTRPSVFTDCLLSLNYVPGGGVIAVYKIPRTQIRWVWGELGLDMDHCPSEY